jgi:Lipid A 3-O-deacylase (PagL)
MRNFSADFRRVMGLLTVLTAFTFTAFAQNLTDEPKADSTDESVSSAAQADDAFNKKNEFAVWGGFAPDIPRLFSGSRKSTFAEVGFRYSRRIATTENLAIKYQIDLIPLAIINYRVERLIQVSPNVLGYNRDRQTAYGAGLTPVSFQLNFRRKAKIQPFLSASAGLLMFNKSLPDDRSALRPNQRGRQFNFTLAGGGGVEFLTDDAKSYIVGFKFHHISNASTGNINPGFDQNLFYFGYTFKKF